MSRTLTARPLMAAAFAPYGQVIDASGAAENMNDGRAERFTDLARIELAGTESRSQISLCHSRAVEVPYSLTFVERHPFGSQAFYPLGAGTFLVIVAPDIDGTPGTPQAFVTAPGEGINLAINTWHGALAPLGQESQFLIVDRAGPGDNLELHQFSEPYEIVMP